MLSVSEVDRVGLIVIGCTVEEECTVEKGASDPASVGTNAADSTETSDNSVDSTPRPKQRRTLLWSVGDSHHDRKSKKERQIDEEAEEDINGEYVPDIRQLRLVPAGGPNDKNRTLWETGVFEVYPMSFLTSRILAAATASAVPSDTCLLKETLDSKCVDTRRIVFVWRCAITASSSSGGTFSYYVMGVNSHHPCHRNTIPGTAGGVGDNSSTLDVNLMLPPFYLLPVSEVVNLFVEQFNKSTASDSLSVENNQGNLHRIQQRSIDIACSDLNSFSFRLVVKAKGSDPGNSSLMIRWFQPSETSCVSSDFPNTSVTPTPTFDISCCEIVSKSDANFFKGDDFGLSLRHRSVKKRDSSMNSSASFQSSISCTPTRDEDVVTYGTVDNTSLKRSQSSNQTVNRFVRHRTHSFVVTDMLEDPAFVEWYNNAHTSVSTARSPPSTALSVLTKASTTREVSKQNDGEKKENEGLHNQSVIQNGKHIPHPPPATSVAVSDTSSEQRRGVCRFSRTRQTGVQIKGSRSEREDTDTTGGIDSLVNGHRYTSKQKDNTFLLNMFQLLDESERSTDHDATTAETETRNEKAERAQALHRVLVRNSQSRSKHKRHRQVKRSEGENEWVVGPHSGTKSTSSRSFRHAMNGTNVNYYNSTVYLKYRHRDLLLEFFPSLDKSLNATDDGQPTDSGRSTSETYRHPLRKENEQQNQIGAVGSTQSIKSNHSTDTSLWQTDLPHIQKRLKAQRRQYNAQRRREAARMKGVVFADILRQFYQKEQEQHEVSRKEWGRKLQRQKNQYLFERRQQRANLYAHRTTIPQKRGDAYQHVVDDFDKSRLMMDEKVEESETECQQKLYTLQFSPTQQLPPLSSSRPSSQDGFAGTSKMVRKEGVVTTDPLKRNEIRRRQSIGKDAMPDLNSVLPRSPLTIFRKAAVQTIHNFRREKSERALIRHKYNYNV